MLADGLRNMKGLLEENTDKTEWLWDIVKELGFSSPSIALKRRAEQLEGENEDFRAKLEEQVEVITPREDKKEDLADRLRCSDWISKTCTAIEMQSLSSVVSSRVQILEEREEREEREAVEHDLNLLGDKFGRAYD